MKLEGIELEVAKGLKARLKGLIGRDDLPAGRGLLIPYCNAIHTFFMRFPIDVVFLDRNDHIVREVNNVRPWRPFVWGGWRASKVIEARAEGK